MAPKARRPAVGSPPPPPPAAATTTTTTTTMVVATEFTPVHRQPKPKRKRKGWGPFQSILKERSVDFNLTLDIQNLRQQIQQLETTRDLLQSRSLQLRHAPTGSLMQTVHEFLRLFRQGFPVQELPYRRQVVTEGERSDFLYSVIDPEIDFGGDNRGVEFMIEMIRRYSLLMRFLAMEMASFEIVQLDDDVVLIKATGTWRFQILRETILAMFPHITGNEWLLSRLVGQELCAPTTILFRFTSSGHICQYQPDADFVATFSEVLKDPEDVAELLGQARIGEHSTIGVAEDGRLEDVDTLTASRPGGRNDRPEGYTQELVTAPVHSRPHDPSHDFLGFYGDVLEQYVAVFARGWPLQSEAEVAGRRETPQAEFLRLHVSPRVVCGHGIGHEAIERGWKDRSAGFEVMNIHTTAVPETRHAYGGVLGRVQLLYRLHIDHHTIHSVFPSLRQYPSLAQALVGATIECPSLLEIEWADVNDPNVVSCIREQLYWDEALTPLLPSEGDRDFVLRHALLSPEGHVLLPASSPQAKHPKSAYPPEYEVML